MRKFLNIFLQLSTILIVLNSCAPDRYEQYNIANQAPVIELSRGQMNGNNEWIVNDRIKMGLKSNPVPLQIRLTAQDEFEVLTFNATFNEASIAIFDQDMNELSLPYDFVTNEETVINIIPASVGGHVIELSITDELGKTSKGRVTIDAFENDPPIAAISEAEYIGLEALNEYRISGSQSYDQDEAFGGRISQYVWTVRGGPEFITTQDNFKQTFNPGGYNVTLRVIDNDGVSSPKVEKIITIR